MDRWKQFWIGFRIAAKSFGLWILGVILCICWLIMFLGDAIFVKPVERAEWFIAHIKKGWQNRG